MGHGERHHGKFMKIPSHCGLIPIDLTDADVGKALVLCPDTRCLRHRAPLTAADYVWAWVSDKDRHRNASPVEFVLPGQMLKGWPVPATAQVGDMVWLDRNLAALTLMDTGDNAVGVVADITWVYMPYRGQSDAPHDYAIPNATAWAHIFSDDYPGRAACLDCVHHLGWGGYRPTDGHRRLIVNSQSSDSVTVYADDAMTTQLATVPAGGRRGFLHSGGAWIAHDAPTHVASVLLR